MNKMTLLIELNIRFICASLPFYFCVLW